MSIVWAVLPTIDQGGISPLKRQIILRKLRGRVQDGSRGDRCYLTVANQGAIGATGQLPIEPKGVYVGSFPRAF